MRHPPSTRRRRSRPPAALVLAVWLAGCAKSASPPPVAPAPPPPAVDAVTPAARSWFVPYDTPIWAEFAESLDPQTVTPLNVYLKIDTVRLPIAVVWEPSTRRIRIQPLVTLRLFRTYTVELSPNLASADGVPLGQHYLWQFTTTSVRRPSAPFPPDRAVESPYTSLSWGGNETTPGSLSYEVYVGPDSAQVAARAVPLVYRGTRAFDLPKARWLEHGANFWSVTVVNASVGERSNGPVWRFDTPAADAPIDSLVVIGLGGGYRKGTSTTGACQPPEFITGGGYYSGIYWTLFTQPQTLRLAGARMDLTPIAAYVDSLPGEATVWFTNNAVVCNFLLSAATDETNGRLASGAVVGPRTLRFESDTLTAHLQAVLRLRTFYGYLFRSVRTIHYVSATGSEPALAPAIRLYFYTGNGTMAPGARGGAAASERSRASPAGRGPPFFPLDRRWVQSVNSR